MDIEEIKEYYGEESIKELKNILGKDVSDDEIVKFLSEECE